MARFLKSPLFRTLGVLCFAALLLSSAEQHGQVKFGGLPLPGATVTATQGDKTITAITDLDGVYTFPDLADGAWSIEVDMLGFETQKREVTIAAGAPEPRVGSEDAPDRRHARSRGAAPPPAVQQPGTTAESKDKPRSVKDLKNAPPAPTNTKTAFQRADLKANPNAQNAPAQESDNSQSAFASQDPSDLSQRAQDGFLINGTANNGASSPFSLSQAFGNNRRNSRSLYSGNLGFIFDTSLLDARPFSLTGQNTPRADYLHSQGVFAFGGPLRIPHLLRNGPQFFINYQWTRNRNAGVQTGLVPTLDQRGGDFSNSLDPFGNPARIFDPATHVPFIDNKIPDSLISPQAKALLRLYPKPNFEGGSRYNYQIPIVSNTHQDALQARLNKQLGRRNQVSGLFALNSTRSDNPNLFSFLDTTDSLGLNMNANWRHSFTQRFFMNLGYQFSRFALAPDALLREPRERIGRRRHHGQQPGAGELGTAVARVFGRHQRPHGRPAVVHAQPDQRRVHRQFLEPRPAQRAVRRRLPPAGIQSALAAESARQFHVHRRSGGQRSRGLPAGSARHQRHRVRQRRQVFPLVQLRRIHQRRLAHESRTHSEPRTALGILVADDAKSTAAW